NSVTTIGSSAFANCGGLTSVTIPNSVTTIGGSAFANCGGLTSVTIPNSVTSIGSSAFANCGGLTSVTIPNSVTSIGSEAFSNCNGLTSVTIPESVTSIGEKAFRNCNGLTSITIPKSVSSIGESAFNNCSNLTKVEISDIAAWCSIIFEDVLANPLFNAHHLSLKGAEVTNLVIPNSVTSIGSNTFCSCDGLTSVTIPNSVTWIGYCAFDNCSGLTSVSIGDSVSEIGESAFVGCTNIMSFTSLNTTPPTVFNNEVFYCIPTDCPLFVPEASVDAYKAAAGWTYFTNVQGIKDGKVDTVGADAVKVTADSGDIRIAGAAGAVAEVYSLSGALLYRGTDATVALPRGMYIVKVAGKTTKIVL
ncbi:MAG: leucine-rich repeat domain-containing protein, partial [Candidatus Limisoma sp.]